MNFHSECYPLNWSYSGSDRKAEEVSGPPVIVVVAMVVDCIAVINVAGIVVAETFVVFGELLGVGA